MKHEMKTMVYIISRMSDHTNRDTSNTAMLNDGYVLLTTTSVIYPSHEMAIVDTFSRPLNVEED
jgi:hypothetical protein